MKLEKRDTTEGLLGQEVGQVNMVKFTYRYNGRCPGQFSVNIRTITKIFGNYVVVYIHLIAITLSYKQEKRKIKSQIGIN